MSMDKRFSKRRLFLKTIMTTMGGVAVLSFCGIMPAFGAEAVKATPGQTKKPLVVYYSETGHTKKIAEMIHNKVGGDILQILPEKPYPKDYDTLVEQAKQELRQDARPAVKTKISNIDDYGVIFLGFPNWWSSMPMPVYTFVEQNGLNGRTIVPFSTNGGGGLGHSIEDLKKLCPKSRVLKPFAIQGSNAASAGDEVVKWLEGLGPALIETTTGNTAIYPDGAY